MSSFQEQIDELKKQVDSLEKTMADSLSRIRSGLQEIELAYLNPKVFLSDTIIKDKLADFRKSLSLNDRFMFQRDIFQNNVEEMNQAFEMLNRFDNLNDALNFLNSNYPIQWESESGIIFRELLEKRFL